MMCGIARLFDSRDYGMILEKGRSVVDLSLTPDAAKV
jgi:hypothetical protein